MSHTTTVEVLRLGATEGKSIPHNLTEFIDALIKARVSIPGEYMDTASIDLEPEYECGEHYRRVVVSYERPETDDERDQRINSDIVHWRDQVVNRRLSLAIAEKKLRDATESQGQGQLV